MSEVAARAVVVVENIPQVDEHGLNDVPGHYIVGDLTGFRCSSFRPTVCPGDAAVQELPDTAGDGLDHQVL